MSIRGGRGGVDAVAVSIGFFRSSTLIGLLKPGSITFEALAGSSNSSIKSSKNVLRSFSFVISLWINNCPFSFVMSPVFAMTFNGYSSSGDATSALSSSPRPSFIGGSFSSAIPSTERKVMRKIVKDP